MLLIGEVADAFEMYGESSCDDTRTRKQRDDHRTAAALSLCLSLFLLRHALPLDARQATNVSSVFYLGLALFTGRVKFRGSGRIRSGWVWLDHLT